VRIDVDANALKEQFHSTLSEAEMTVDGETMSYDDLISKIATEYNLPVEKVTNFFEYQMLSQSSEPISSFNHASGGGMNSTMYIRNVDEILAGVAKSFGHDVSAENIAGTVRATKQGVHSYMS
jgi:hypothetical protein